MSAGTSSVLIRASHCYNQSDMRCLILAVFFAIAQTPTPTSRKATNSASGTAHAVAKDGNDSRDPINLSPSITNPVAIDPSQTASNTSKPQDAPQSVRIRELPPVSVTKDWADWGVWAFSGLLVMVGILQFCVLWRQAKIMGEHARHLDNLAKAAKDNAQALISSERAWILVDIGKLPPFAPEPNLVQILWIFPTIKNYGKTVARITRVTGIVKLIPEGEKLPIAPEYIPGQGFDQQIDMVLPPEVPMQP